MTPIFHGIQTRKPGTSHDAAPLMPRFARFAPQGTRTASVLASLALIGSTLWTGTTHAEVVSGEVHETPSAPTPQAPRGYVQTRMTALSTTLFPRARRLALFLRVKESLPIEPQPPLELALSGLTMVPEVAACEVDGTVILRNRDVEPATFVVGGKRLAQVQPGETIAYECTAGTRGEELRTVEVLEWPQVRGGIYVGEVGAPAVVGSDGKFSLVAPKGTYVLRVIGLEGVLTERDVVVDGRSVNIGKIELDDLPGENGADPMGFWIRHLLLLLAVVVAPVAAVLWLDTETEIGHAKDSGLRAAAQAAESLSARVELSVRAHVDEAMSAAHDLELAQVLDLVADARAYPRRRSAQTKSEEALALAAKRLARVRPSGGFAWLTDGEGRVIAGLEGSSDAEGPRRSVVGHPLFVQSQLGFASDMLWRQDDPLIWAASAPLVSEGSARGAVLLGWPIDQIFVSGLSRRLGFDVTLTEDKQVTLTSLEGEGLTAAIEPALEGSTPVVAGALSTPLPSPLPGILPLFMGPKADGLAFASQAVAVPGTDMKWVVSIPAATTLEALAERQIQWLAGGLVLAMVILLFAVFSHRIYVRPLRIVADHLSENHRGQGELELPERKVSGPFRRLVKLVNMTVQRLPARGIAVSRTGETLNPSGALPAASRTEEDMSSESGAASAASQPSLNLRLDQLMEDERPLEASGDGEAASGDSDLAQVIAALGASPPASDGPRTQAEGQSSVADAPTPSGKKSPSAIRGGTPHPDIVLDEDFHEISQFTLPPVPKAAVAQVTAGVRGGGSLDLGQGAGITKEGAEKEGDSTVVSPVQEELLAQSAQEELTGHHDAHKNQDMTVVATVDPKLLSQTLTGAGAEDALKNGLDESDWSHFKEVYEDFLALREKCGERTKDIAFERFLTKLKKNRQKLIDKYNCKTVRFQVYEKEGKAALKATPVRSR